MKEVFEIYNFLSKNYPNQEALLHKLICTINGVFIVESPADLLLKTSLEKNGVIDPLVLFQLIGLVHQKRKESEVFLNTNSRKHFGIYYTDYSVARLIAKESLGGITSDKLLDLTFYEPCVGTGIFVIAYLDELIERIGKVDSRMIKKILNQVFISDIDANAVRIATEIIPAYLKNKHNIHSAKLRDENLYCGNILFRIVDQKIEKVDPKEIFGIKEGFDVVLTNPPYKLLKANGNKYRDGFDNNEQADHMKKLISFIKSNNIYKYNQGTLNYYKIFLEEILENYTHGNSRVGVIIPITLLNDKQSELLRKRIINTYSLSKLHIIPEKNDFFPDISQAFSFFSLDKSKPGDVVIINPKVVSHHDLNKPGIKIEISHIEQISESAPIVIESELGWKILKKLNSFPKLKNLTAVCNARGELDLTLDKNYITKNKTTLPLLRGNNVSEFSYTLGDLYTDEVFVNKIIRKSKYVKRERLVCQQISNIHLEKRLKFTKIPGNMVLGNSCNFITFDESIFRNEVTLDYLLGILNSMLLNWRFKVTNSNNHISNYELAELPIVIPSSKNLKKIERLVKSIKEGKVGDVYKLNMIVFDLYGLDKEERDYIVGKHRKFLSPYAKIMCKKYVA